MAEQQIVREARKRVRLTPAQRTEQILTAATRLVARKGYYGVSLQDVADEVGITQAGLLHYVRNKEGLLGLLVEQQYDRAGTPQDYIASGDPGAVHPDGPSFPGYLRYLVAFNSTRAHLIQLYMVLGAESASEQHPAHAYFADRPTSVWELYSSIAWRLPPSIGSFDEIRHLVEMSLEAMDGIQVRMFRRPAISIVEEWARFEQVLFPSPVWDDYR
ncbi:TetR/AcrR family transcriptional regulator [Cellulomonas soli]|uniref:TetR/AcrR family transcriptional regulator n=1 Tax=Cellulomonas soli TaxID=931535 RepID=UPI003F828974